MAVHVKASDYFFTNDIHVSYNSYFSPTLEINLHKTLADHQSKGLLLDITRLFIYWGSAILIGNPTCSDIYISIIVAFLI